jgi:hypothetical protein
MASGTACEIEHSLHSRRRDDSLYQGDYTLGFRGIAMRIKRYVLLAEPSLKPF